MADNAGDAFTEALRAAIQARWSAALNYNPNDKEDKLGRYVGKFFNITFLKDANLFEEVEIRSMGMNPRHLSAIRSGELRNHVHNELGATKLACLWVIEHFERGTFKKAPSKGISINAKANQN